jgi:hypothetical protein
VNLQPSDYFLALMGVVNATWSWRLFTVLNRLDTKLAKIEGLMDGWNLDERVTRLERKVGLGVRNDA